MCHGLRTARVARVEARHHAGLVELGLELGLVEVAAAHPPHDPHDPRQQDQVQQPDHDQERARHERPDQPGRLLQSRAVVLDRAAEPAHADHDQHAEREHDRRVPEREPEADAERALALRHQLACGVVDRGDVVGVEGVAEAERVGGDAEADTEDAGGAELVAARRDDHDQQEEADGVQRDHDRREDRDPAPLRRGQRPLGARPARCGVRAHLPDPTAVAKRSQ
jgi:hypothetical protein